MPIRDIGRYGTTPVAAAVLRWSAGWAAVCASLFWMPAQANPNAPKVVHGTATFNQSGKTLQVTNTPGTVIDWGSFSIGSGELTRFVQQSATSAVLNRVIGASPSAILGALQSNGRVFLINPNGVLFGSGAQVDVAGLVVSTLNLSNADFLAGKMRFTQTAGAGGISNKGTIRVGGGKLLLVGADVGNDGVLSNSGGDIVLAAGRQVELIDSVSPHLRVEISAPGGEARNLGRIVVDAGRLGIYAGLIRHDGMINADSAVAGKDGSIVLKASKALTLGPGSELTARGSAQARGGFIETSAEKVVIDPSARIDTSAANGRTGTWLLDPSDFAIAPTGGNISGAALSNSLTFNNVVLATAADGNGSGDMFVNDNVVWSSGHTLTLSAHRDIRFGHNAGIALDGSGNGSVVLNAGGMISASLLGEREVRARTLATNARAGIGTSTAPLRTAVAQAAVANAESGGIALLNAGNLVVSGSSAGDFRIRTVDGPLIYLSIEKGSEADIVVNAPLTAGGDVELRAGRGYGRSLMPGNGGVGGSIAINAAVVAAGTLDFVAGAGGTGGSSSVGGGNGGTGGAIVVSAAGRVESTTGGAITLHSGGGGRGGDSDLGGGAGGGSGAIVLDGWVRSSGSIALATGAAGNGGVGTSDRDGGDAGRVGDIAIRAALTAATDIALATGAAGVGGNSMFSAIFGDTGRGGHGGRGGSVDIDGAVTAGGAFTASTLRGGAGGVSNTIGRSGGDGGSAGSIRVHAAITSGGAINLATGGGGASGAGLFGGSGGNAGDGGVIAIAGPVEAGGGLTLVTGSGADSPGNAFGDSFIIGGDGGQGGNIAITAPATVVGAVRLTTGNGGAGGNGGVGGRGGSGGSIVVDAMVRGATEFVSETGRGGFGSGGGSRAGAGGTGGDIALHYALDVAGLVSFTSGSANGSGSTFNDSGGVAVAAGGRGGNIVLNDGVVAQGNIRLVTGSGGGGGGYINHGSGAAGGAGGSITLHGALQSAGNVHLATGGGSGGGIGIGAGLQGGSGGAGGAILTGPFARLTALGAGGIKIATGGGGGGGGPSGTGGSAASGASCLLDFPVFCGTGGLGGPGGGNPGGMGGAGGNIVLGAATATGGNLLLRAGSGGFGAAGTPPGSGGSGGGIALAGAVSAAGATTLTAGASGGLAGAAGIIAGSMIDVRSEDALVIDGRVVPDSGEARLSAALGIRGSVGPVRVDSPTLWITNSIAGMVELTNVGTIHVAGAPSHVFSAHLVSTAGDIVLDAELRAVAGGDAIRLAGTAFVNNAGAAALSAPAGRWIVWSRHPAANEFQGLQSGNDAVWNSMYPPVNPTLAQAGNRYAFEVSAPIGIGFVRAEDRTKTYGDASSGFTYRAFEGSGGASYGFAFNDPGGGPVALSGTPVLTSVGAASSATRNAGIGGGPVYAIDVDLTGVSATGVSSLQGVSGRLTVARRPVTVTASGSKTYDATLSLPAASLIVDNLAAGDVVTANAMVSFADKHAGSGKPLTLDDVSLSDRVNYRVNVASGTGDIVPRVLQTSFTGENKTYDGTFAATALSGDDRIAGDQLTLSFLSVYADKNAGNGRAIDITDIRALGPDAGNYSVATTARTSANIVPARLTVRAEDAVKRVGEPDPPFRANFLGFVPGEGRGDLTGVLEFATAALSPLGWYAIIPSGLSSLNYNIVFIDGRLHVTGFEANVSNDLVVALGHAINPLFPSAQSSGRVELLQGGAVEGFGTASAGSGQNCRRLDSGLFDCR